MAVKTIMSCIRRDKDWIAYHADSLASLTDSNQVNTEQLDLTTLERRAFRLMRNGYFEKAITQLEDTVSRGLPLTPRAKDGSYNLQPA